MTTFFISYRNVPIRDPSDLPDPYVILYLLPKRLKDSKRKTIVVKNSCDPVYEVTFEYGSINPIDLKTTELEVTVKTKMPFLSGGSLTIGMVMKIRKMIIRIANFVNFVSIAGEN